MIDVVSAEFIARAKRGEKQVISELYDRFHQPVFRYLYYRVGDAQIAEDLAAEVFLRMLSGLENYRVQGAPFEAWLYQIARNLSVDHYRRNGRASALTEDLPAGGDGVDQVIEAKLTRAGLVQALKQLNEPQKDVILLRFINQMPIAEVARVLHRSEDSVKGLQRRALLALRQALSEWEVQDVNDG